MDSDFKQSVLTASQRPDVRAAVADLYARVQGEIETRRPVCVISGRCCRFEEFGHRLFVTTMEMAAFAGSISDQEPPRPDPPPPSTGGGGISLPVWDGTGCPYQKNKLCSVHAIRPFGCRMFFCDATSTEWQNEQYERFHAELKRLHQALEVPYFYKEWRVALHECLSIQPDIL